MSFVQLICALSVGVGCSDRGSPEFAGADMVGHSASDTVATPAPPRSELLSANTVRFTEPVVVRMAPDTAAVRLGTIAPGTRLKPLEFQTGPGCSEGWIRIAEQDWVCARYLEPDENPPLGEELPVMPPDHLVPGEYGDVKNNSAVLYANPRSIVKGVPSRQITGHTVLRKVDEVEVDGQSYWKTASGEYILARDIKPYKPSTFHGLQLENGIQLPLILVMPGADPTRPAIQSDSVVYLSAGRGFAPVLERLPVGRPRRGEKQQYRYRIQEEEWVASPFIRYASAVKPPPDIQPGERWIDINLDEQVLVAYEGETPVYVTLVSTGRLDPTPRGMFRIYLKYAETSMASEMGDDRPYQIEKVPWTQFFHAGIALHCAFWHNGFGYQRSRGCVNLSPIDARFIYHWADPQPPAGWSAVNGLPERPGTLVRIHRNSPEALHYYGYARDVAKARGVRIPSSPKLSDQMAESRQEIRDRILAQRAREAELAAKQAASATVTSQSPLTPKRELDPVVNPLPLPGGTGNPVEGGSRPRAPESSSPRPALTVPRQAPVAPAGGAAVTPPGT